MNKVKNAEKWKGNEDLSHFNENFIFEVAYQLQRCEILIKNGILEKHDDDLFFSALTEFLVLVRSLIWKYNKLTDSNKTELQDKIILFRDALCHTDHKNNRDGKVQFRIVALPVDDNEEIAIKVTNNPANLIVRAHSDDVVVFLGGSKLSVKKELIATCQTLLNYFWGNLPDEHSFWQLSQQHIHQSTH